MPIEMASSVNEKKNESLALRIFFPSTLALLPKTFAWHQRPTHTTTTFRLPIFHERFFLIVIISTFLAYTESKNVGSFIISRIEWFFKFMVSNANLKLKSRQLRLQAAEKNSTFPLRADLDFITFQRLHKSSRNFVWPRQGVDLKYFPLAAFELNWIAFLCSNHCATALPCT